jgi:hypothetical protein
VDGIERRVFACVVRSAAVSIDFLAAAYAPLNMISASSPRPVFMKKSICVPLLSVEVIFEVDAELQPPPPADDTVVLSASRSSSLTTTGSNFMAVPRVLLRKRLSMRITASVSVVRLVGGVAADDVGEVYAGRSSNLAIFASAEMWSTSCLPRPPSFLHSSHREVIRERIWHLKHLGSIDYKHVLHRRPRQPKIALHPCPYVAISPQP